MEGLVRVGSRYSIVPFGSPANVPSSGQVFFRIFNINESITGLQRFIYINFAIPNFESTLVVAVTYIEVPNILDQYLQSK